jgi:hypothetical protein
MGGVLGTLAGLVTEAFARNDPIQIFEIVFAGIEAVVDGLSWAASSFPKHADEIYGVLGAVTTILGSLNVINALIHGVAAWLLWTIRATVFAAMIAAKGPIAVVISLMLSFAGSLIQAAAQWATTVATTKYADAAHQENMSVWDWCAGPGKGRCTAEPNGGMPIA